MQFDLCKGRTNKNIEIPWIGMPAFRVDVVVCERTTVQNHLYLFALAGAQFHSRKSLQFFWGPRYACVRLSYVNLSHLRPGPVSGVGHVKRNLVLARAIWRRTGY